MNILPMGMDTMSGGHTPVRGAGATAGEALLAGLAVEVGMDVAGPGLPRTRYAPKPPSATPTAATTSHAFDEGAGAGAGAVCIIAAPVATPVRACAPAGVNWIDRCGNETREGSPPLTLG